MPPGGRGSGAGVPARAAPGSDGAPGGAVPLESRGSLPELASIPWRRPTSAESLRRWGRIWTLWTAVYSAPLIVAGIGMPLLEPLTAPVALAVLAHAWIIPELYAARGAKVLGPRGGARPRGEPVAQGLLADLLGHEARDLQRSTGLAMERGRLGVWLIGEAGGLLVPPGGRRVHCFCVATTDRTLPPSDRIAHLLLALRTDEQGFATLANHAFSGAPWRIRRRLPRAARPALARACRAARR